MAEKSQYQSSWHARVCVCVCVCVCVTEKSLRVIISGKDWLALSMCWWSRWIIMSCVVFGGCWPWLRHSRSLQKRLRWCRFLCSLAVTHFVPSFLTFLSTPPHKVFPHFHQNMLSWLKLETVLKTAYSRRFMQFYSTNISHSFQSRMVSPLPRCYIILKARSPGSLNDFLP